MGKPGRTRKIFKFLGISVLLACYAAIATSLFFQHRFMEATGWCICTGFLIFVIILYHVPYEWLVGSGPIAARRITAEKHPKEGELHNVLFSSKDPVAISHVIAALKAGGVDCALLDQHSSIMLNFLPEVEMRITAPAKQFRKGRKIIAGLGMDERWESSTADRDGAPEI